MEKVYISNKKSFQEKIKEIKKQGINKLHVVSDFDRTLSRSFLNGKKIPSISALIREGNYLSADYSKKAFALFDKYYPIEIDESLDYDYRFNKMQEWWQEHEKLFIEFGMHRKVIDDVLKKYPKILRDGSSIFFDYLNSNNIPLLIFSAGIGNLIKGYLSKEGKLSSNVYILSNIFNFDEDGYATGYKNKAIHTMNKSEIKIENEDYKKLISKRDNVMLLGDSLGDIGMINNFNNNIVVKVGFLNEDIENKLELYKNKFDVVIVNDGSMTYVNKILNELK